MINIESLKKAKPTTLAETIKSSDSTRPTGTMSDHAHKWRIDEPHGPESHGVCTKCGKEKLFKNSMPDSDFLSPTERSFY